MNKTSFFIGMLSGIVLTIVALFVIGFVRQKNNEDDAIQRLEKPVSYENKKAIIRASELIRAKTNHKGK